MTTPSIKNNNNNNKGRMTVSREVAGLKGSVDQLTSLISKLTTTKSPHEATMHDAGTIRSSLSKLETFDETEARMATLEAENIMFKDRMDTIESTYVSYTEATNKKFDEYQDDMNALRSQVGIFMELCNKYQKDIAELRDVIKATDIENAEKIQQIRDVIMAPSKTN